MGTRRLRTVRLWIHAWRRLELEFSPLQRVVRRAEWFVFMEHESIDAMSKDPKIPRDEPPSKIKLTRTHVGRSAVTVRVQREPQEDGLQVLMSALNEIFKRDSAITWEDAWEMAMESSVHANDRIARSRDVERRLKAELRKEWKRWGGA